MKVKVFYILPKKLGQKSMAPILRVFLTYQKTDLLPLLWTDSSIVVASFNEHSSYALSVLCEAIGLHETNNTVSPEPFVHVDAVLRITVLLEENEASFH